MKRKRYCLTFHIALICSQVIRDQGKYRFAGDPPCLLTMKSLRQSAPTGYGKDCCVVPSIKKKSTSTRSRSPRITAVRSDSGCMGRRFQPPRAPARTMPPSASSTPTTINAVSYTHLRAHETDSYLV